MRQLRQPIVLRGVEPDNLHMRLDEIDRRQEQGPVQALLVEIARGDVRGGDDRHALGEKGGEEAAEDHGVGDVVDAEFVEAEKPSLCRRDRPRRERSGRHPDGVPLLGLPPSMDAGMHVAHKGVEVHAAFRLDRALGRRRDPSTWSCHARHGRKRTGLAAPRSVSGRTAMRSASRSCLPRPGPPRAHPAERRDPPVRDRSSTPPVECAFGTVRKRKLPTGSQDDWNRRCLGECALARQIGMRDS